MKQFIGCDAHKRFSAFAWMNEEGKYGLTIRVGHDREEFREFLRELPGSSEIALETSVVWIPPAELRDQREMLRWRMTLSNMRTRVKNRIHGVLQRYNLDIAVSDLFGNRCRATLLARQNELPTHSRQSVMEQLRIVDTIETEIGECERMLEEMLYPSTERDVLDSLPCVGKVLSAVLALELGDVRRFSEPEKCRNSRGELKLAAAR